MVGSALGKHYRTLNWQLAGTRLMRAVKAVVDPGIDLEASSSLSIWV